MKTKILNSMKTTGLALAGMATAVVLNINIAYASVAEMLDPVLLMIESELLIIGKRLCVAAIIGCGIKYAFASDAQSAKNAKDWGTRILLGLIIMVLATDIVPLFADMVTKA